MASKVIQQFGQFRDYVRSLNEGVVDDVVWLEPIAPGKWSLKELLCHLWYWDVYSLERMVPYFEHNAKLPEFMDIDTYNKEAITQASTFTNIDSLVSAFVETRTKMIHTIEKIYDPAIRFTIGKGKRQYSIDSYVKIFVDHDEHHRKQIELLLNS